MSSSGWRSTTISSKARLPSAWCATTVCSSANPYCWSRNDRYCGTVTAAIVNALPGFFGRFFEPWNSIIENPEQVAVAIEWYEAGCDFADALHLASSGATTMHTFDRAFCKAARDAGIAPEVRIWET